MSQNSRKLNVLCVFGTRPDTVKMAPVVQALKRRSDQFSVRIVVTGQHREQLDQALRVFDLIPDNDLAIMQHGQTLTQITTRALEGLDADLTAHKADICLAQGDTTTTFAAALAAFYHQTPFGHVEAGLRTGNRYDPFPEEMNRRLTAPIAEWHFAPTEQARDHLLAEGIPAKSIHVTGNTSIDALRIAASMPYKFEEPVLQRIMGDSKKLILVTAHRRENWGEPMREIAHAISQISDEFNDYEIVVAMHRNPIVRESLIPILQQKQQVHLVEPQEYVPFIKLMQRAHIILTDSGGVQEEAPTLGVPILVLRRTTERGEGVDAGTAILVGTDREEIVNQTRNLLTDAELYTRMSKAANPYGDGNAAERIVSALGKSR